MARRIRRAVSGNDVVARIGGDEFLVVVFGGDVNMSATIVERLSKQVREPLGVSGGHAIEVSVAIGQASTDKPTLVLDDLLRASDREMYLSKRANVD